MKLTTRWCAVLVLGAVTLAGCAYLTPQSDLTVDTGDSTSELSDTEPSGGAPQSSVIEEATGTNNAQSTADDAAESSTTAPATSSTTIPEPLGVNELVLKSDGLGGARFGAEPNEVVNYVSSILGSPTEDSDWVSPDARSCPGTAVRSVKWGVLSLMFGDESSSATGRAHFMSYTYGVIDKFGEEPTGLMTSDGITITDSVGSLLERIDVQLNEGDESLDIPPSFFYESAPFPVTGLLSGTTADDVVLVISSGSGCFG